MFVQAVGRSSLELLLEVADDGMGRAGGHRQSWVSPVQFTFDLKNLER